MRFPSLFRLPRSQQFEIKPRYYDPVKEFVKERERYAKSAKGKKSNEPYEGTRIAFQRRKSSVGLNASLMQLIIALLLGSMVVGWLYIGNEVFYYGLILAPFYLYFRIRKR